MNKKYWQNFRELNQSESFAKENQDEFREELPLAELDEKGILDGNASRREFLKYLGFSTAAAAIAAGCEIPVRKAIPFVNRPDDVIPGVANYYASTYVSGGDAVSVVVKQRDGRPIKIEGNKLSAITNGGTNARVQASVLDLYDPTRLRHPLQRDGESFKEVPSFDAIDKMIADGIAGLGGKPVVLLTGTVNSPSTQDIITQFLAKYPGSRHVQYDAMSSSAMLLANEACYGKRALPSYHFDKAKVIVSLGADFLGSWISPVEFSNQYAVNRKINAKNPSLSHHIQFESMMSLTGSNADDRFTHKPSETGAIALALLSKLGGSVSAPAIKDAQLAKGIEKAAAALKANQGAGLVVCGSNDSNIQVIVNAINEMIGASGNTIDWSTNSNYRKGIDADMKQLASDISNGTVGGLLVYDCNPVYTYNDGRKLGEAISKLPLSVSFNSTMDETTECCKYVIPSHHWLESWGDAEPKSGTISLIQPLINPLFKTRSWQTSLMKLAGMTGDYENQVRAYWLSKLGGEDNWNKALQDGLITGLATTAYPPAFNASKVAEASAALTSVKSGDIEIVIYENIGVGNGKQANNPWLQELPDPISKVTWDNYAMISPAMAKSLLNIDILNEHDKKQADKYEVHPEKPVIKITVNGKSIELPAMIVPGMHASVIAMAAGYGRESAKPEMTGERIGLAAAGAGKNVYPLVSSSGNDFSYWGTASVAVTGATYPLAQTQVHAFSEGRPIIFETSLSEYAANPEKVLEEPRTERQNLLAEGKTDFVKDGTIYPDYVKPGVKWGMSIDLNTCTGCSACVVACIAENNISVVGKKQVQLYHDMHWLRIDRYFTGDPNNPDVIFQPMLCQHCDNAPCENVCPVAATNHSSEGLNQMAYNRCIGTRYCANNCPYKVRRFNWLDYTGADSFPNNQNPIIGESMDPVVLQMNDDLTRMVLNPDVTVRSRGVMEKCSFCVQRLQENKLEAKKNQDSSMVRNVQTACSQACPTGAITFGNVNDKESDIYKVRHEEQENRNFYVLEHLHVLPNVSYLAKVRNTDRKVGVAEEAEHA
jgi:molybdopterin-containing oxidoreductase family iron-sulfur binding subunit